MISISEIKTTAPETPLSNMEKRVYETLDSLEIPYERVENDVVETME